MSSAQLLVRIERRQIVEVDAVADRLGVVEVDRRDSGQREIALALLGTADFALDGVAGAEAEAADDRRSDVNVVGAGEIIGFGRTEEAEAVVEHLDGAGAHDLDAIFGLDLEDREHEVLLAHGRCAFDAHFLGHRDELGGGVSFSNLSNALDGLFLGSCARSFSMSISACRRGRTPLDWERSPAIRGTGREPLRFEVCSQCR